MHKEFRRRQFVTIEKALSNSQWHKLLKIKSLNANEIQLLENFRKAQKYGELWISRKDALERIKLSSLYGLRQGLHKKIDDTNFRVRKQRYGNYGFFAVNKNHYKKGGK